jgi:hypothetical protein
MTVKTTVKYTTHGLKWPRSGSLATPNTGKEVEK